jgi:hypothetical protein
MDEESTGAMVTQPGITKSSTRNPPEEWLFSLELLARQGRGIHRRNAIPPEIASSLTRNPPEEGDSAGNNQPMEAVSDRQDQNAQKILQTVTISG